MEKANGKLTLTDDTQKETIYFEQLRASRISSQREAEIEPSVVMLCKEIYPTGVRLGEKIDPPGLKRSEGLDLPGVRLGKETDPPGVREGKEIDPPGKKIDPPKKRDRSTKWEAMK